MTLGDLKLGALCISHFFKCECEEAGTNYLTTEEASEMRDDLERMLKNSEYNTHTHINDALYKHEITVAIYEEGNINLFNDRTKKLVLIDE